MVRTTYQISGAYPPGIAIATATPDDGDMFIAQTHTLVKYGNQVLFIVQNITASNLTDVDFTPVDIDESLAN